MVSADLSPENAAAKHCISNPCPCQILRDKCPWRSQPGRNQVAKTMKSTAGPGTSGVVDSFWLVWISLMDHKSDQTKQIKIVVELEPMITYDDLCFLLVSTGFNHKAQAKHGCSVSRGSSPTLRAGLGQSLLAQSEGTSNCRGSTASAPEIRPSSFPRTVDPVMKVGVYHLVMT